MGAGPAVAQPTNGDAVNDRVPMPGSTPQWARPDLKAGRVSPGSQRRVLVALSLRNRAEAQQRAIEVSTPGSPRYRHFLTAEQFVDRFGPDQHTVDRVRTWLQEAGLHVEGVSANRHLVTATGRVEQLERAFGTGLARYRYGKDVLVAPESPVRIPADLRGEVSAVLGLDDSHRLIRSRLVRSPQQTTQGPEGSGGAEEDCAEYWAQHNNTAVPQKYPEGRQSNVLCGYTANQLRAIYGLGQEATGAGRTIGITGECTLATAESDTNRWSRRMGLPPLRPGQYREVLQPGAAADAPECRGSGWGVEQALDIQSVRAMAPDADIVYYGGAPESGSVFEALNTAIAQNETPVISNSWGEDEPEVPTDVRTQFADMVTQAANQGQSILFSSGDSGDNSGPSAFGFAAPDFPAESPMVTAVGGTSVGLDAQNRVEFTTGWENSADQLQDGQWAPIQSADGDFIGGAGGGVSPNYSMPIYQRGVVSTRYARGQRAVPDISALANNFTGMRIGFTQAPHGFVLEPVGGTSLASPLIAGLLADRMQVHGVQRMGFLNPWIYRSYRSPGLADVTHHDAGVWTSRMHLADRTLVTGSYLVDFDSKPQSLQSMPGWDPVTGVGTPTRTFVYGY
nr:S53 family peptidase [Longimycelium tulufanense]